MDDQQTPLEQLRAVMAALRTPGTGCPWDLKQNFASISPYTIEEAYEVVDAIARGNMDDLKLELGDLLLQVVFHARMAEEQGLFDFNDVAIAISDKMKYRHPHVFSDTHVADAGQVQDNWEALKAAERAEKAPDSGPQSLMDDVPTALPGLTRAVKLQKRAAQVGFDWQAAAPILAKLDEEVAEFKAEMNAEAIDEQRLTDEFGDILFVMANLARHLKLDPETAIRSTNRKFDRRFRFIEQKALENGEKMDEMSLEALEAYWQESKHIVG